VIGVAGCGKPADRFVGVWTGDTYDTKLGAMQITIHFMPDGTERLSTVMMGKDLGRLDPKPPIETAGTYAVRGDKLIQTFGKDYPESETLATESPTPDARRMTATWTIDDDHLLTLNQPGRQQPVKLGRVLDIKR